MAIPDYQSVMLPLIRFCRDKQEHSLREAIEVLADEFSLTGEERKQLLPSGQQAVFDNRVGWARSYLKQAGLLESTRRGFFRITARGLEVLRQSPRLINVQFLGQFPEFVEFRSRRHTRDDSETEPEGNLRNTPEESLESAYQKIRQELAGELLQKVKSCSPSFFERLVVELIVKMGYGGTRQDAGKAIGKSRDGGIDGIIKEDRLGLDIIYIQAKRWEYTVGRPEIQKFVGALQGQRAKKGLFITTSDFTQDAEEYASRI